MFLILQELMHRTFVEIEGRAPRRHEIPKPCDHFDLIVGTGTGGLIALMLGRLRLDIETCKELYVRMTRMVFETDKTIVGIPYRSTLFKATKLEEAIKEAVREHTVYEREGNDSSEYGATVASRSSAASNPKRNLSNASTVSFSARSPTAQAASRPQFFTRGGNPNARLYDERENRTKTYVSPTPPQFNMRLTDPAPSSRYTGAPREGVGPPSCAPTTPAENRPPNSTARSGKPGAPHAPSASPSSPSGSASPTFMTTAPAASTHPSPPSTRPSSTSGPAAKSASSSRSERASGRNRATPTRGSGTRASWASSPRRGAT